MFLGWIQPIACYFATLAFKFLWFYATRHRQSNVFAFFCCDFVVLIFWLLFLNIMDRTCLSVNYYTYCSLRIFSFHAEFYGIIF